MVLLSVSVNAKPSKRNRLYPQDFFDSLSCIKYNDQSPMLRSDPDDIDFDRVIRAPGVNDPACFLPSMSFSLTPCKRVIEVSIFPPNG